MKPPRFYCEYCGAEVKRNARVCPSCGKFFSSVKCPKCGHVGTSSEFAHGCPVCGYSEEIGGEDPLPENTMPQSDAARVSPWIAGAVVICLVAAVSVLAVILLGP